MITLLLEALPPEKWLQLREAFEEETELRLDCCLNNKCYWIGVHVSADTLTTGREGLYSYGEK